MAMLVFSAVGMAADDQVAFPDVPQSHWAHSTIQWAVANGVVGGYTDGTFKPDQSVTEPEFLAILYRTFLEPGLIPQSAAGESWYQPYFTLAESYHWPVWYETDGAQYNRGRVAQVLAASQGVRLDMKAAVQYLLDHQLANGKTSATVEGFAMLDKLTRAEAVKLIHNLHTLNLTLGVAVTQPGAPADIPGSDVLQVNGIAIGDSEAAVIDKLGQPDRSDRSEYGFLWYVYNQDYTRYIQVGIADGRVVGLYTNAAEWSSPEGVKRGSSWQTLVDAYGDSLEAIEKGNTRFMIRKEVREESPTYLLDSGYVTFFIDLLDGRKVSAVQVIEEKTEQSFLSFYAESSEELRISMERQVFDLANAARALHGKEILQWNDELARLASAHSEDMASQGYFSHNNPAGQSPFDRIENAGMDYRYAAENIAGGQRSAIFAHESWMNSQGHRDNILSDKPSELGVGVRMGGPLYIYYTQNFYTAR